MKLLPPNFLLIAPILGVFALTSCTVTMNADGSKSATVDAPTAIRVIEIIATK